MLQRSQSSTLERLGEFNAGGEFFVDTPGGPKQATSYEFYVAKALDTVGIRYIFQYQFFGGRALRGGMVVDFLALTSPLSTPIWVHGEYWHLGRQTTIDKYQLAVLYQFQAGLLAQAVVLWGADVKTPEAALAAVRRELRV
jgi:hypothetical protein